MFQDKIKKYTYKLKRASVIADASFYQDKLRKYQIMSKKNMKGGSVDTTNIDQIINFSRVLSNRTEISLILLKDVTQELSYEEILKGLYEYIIEDVFVIRDSENKCVTYDLLDTFTKDDEFYKDIEEKLKNHFILFIKRAKTKLDDIAFRNLLRTVNFYLYNISGVYIDSLLIERQAEPPTDLIKDIKRIKNDITNPIVIEKLKEC
ncbi:MAG: hypothetical protein CMF62_00500 [Magnetococcales bacterium]|nr:hypothetical protein [Magnetococcales bacterium]|tara:strand:- start:2322 stop:2939 length:618 start_codon:yes stop_codon:yes gene_type:complete